MVNQKGFAFQIPGLIMEYQQSMEDQPELLFLNEILYSIVANSGLMWYSWFIKLERWDLKCYRTLQIHGTCKETGLSGELGKALRRWQTSRLKECFHRGIPKTASENIEDVFSDNFLRHTSGSNNPSHQMCHSIVFQHSLSLSSRTKCPRHQVELGVIMVSLRGGKTEFPICNCSGTKTWCEKEGGSNRNIEVFEEHDEIWRELKKLIPLVTEYWK